MKNNKKNKLLAMLLGLSSVGQLPGNASALEENRQVERSYVSDRTLQESGKSSLGPNLGVMEYLKLFGVLGVPALALNGVLLYKFFGNNKDFDTKISSMKKDINDKFASLDKKVNDNEVEVQNLFKTLSGNMDKNN